MSSKREILHALIDKLLDIEESSSKVCFLRYSGHVGVVGVDVSKNKEAFLTRLFEESCISLDDESLYELSEKLDRVSSIPDGPVEKMISLQIEESKAKDLGLIA